MNHNQMFVAAIGLAFSTGVGAQTTHQTLPEKSVKPALDARQVETMKAVGQNQQSIDRKDPVQPPSELKKPQLPEQKQPVPEPPIKKPGQPTKSLKQPDLIVSGIAVPYGRTLRPGQNLGNLMKAAGKNIGTAPAPGTIGSLDPGNGYMIDIVLSTDRNAPVRLARYSNTFHEDVLIKGGRFSRTVDLGPGDRKSYQDGTAIIPENIKPGTYYFCAVIDPGNKVNESNEGNNVQCGSSVKIGKPAAGSGSGSTGGTTGPDPADPGGFTGAAPDLIAVLTHPMTGKVTVRNIGTAGADASKLVLTCESPISSHPDGGGQCPESPSLAAYADPPFRIIRSLTSRPSPPAALTVIH